MQSSKYELCKKILLLYISSGKTVISIDTVLRGKLQPLEISKYKIEKNTDSKTTTIKKCPYLFAINWDSFLKVLIKLCLFDEINFGVFE